LQTLPVGLSDVTATASTSKSFADLTTDDFLRVLVAELIHQDPLEPMSNQDLLGQLTQIRSLESSMSLTANLTNLIAQQRLSTASSLIGRFVTAMDSDGSVASGVVESVRVVNGISYLVIGDVSVPVELVVEIREAEVEGATDGSPA